MGLKWVTALFLTWGFLPEPARAQECSDATPEAFVDERISHWKRRLNLQQWNVSVAMVTRADLKQGTLGGIRWDKRRKAAVMSVMAPSEYKMSRCEMLKDMEFTVVHELVHLQLAALPRSQASRSSEEHAVNNIARALLGSYDTALMRNDKSVPVQEH